MSDKNTVFKPKTTINAGGHLVDFSEPKVMGILNLTPDSFYQASRVATVETALTRAEKMLNEGADILDLGAYSSRPGADDLPPTEEEERLLPVIKAIRNEFPQAILSIDTFRASVAEASIAAGAHIINDISGGELDPKMFETIGRLQVPYILMHMRGTPRTMNSLAHYKDIVGELITYFSQKLALLREQHVHDAILDPGFGFAKSATHNFTLLHHLEEFKILGLPILVGLSRKRTIWQTLNITSEEALNGTSVLNTIALLKGASILRVHDVKEAAEAVKLVSSVIGAELPSGK